MCRPLEQICLTSEIGNFRSIRMAPRKTKVELIENEVWLGKGSGLLRCDSGRVRAKFVFGRAGLGLTFRNPTWVWAVFGPRLHGAGRVERGLQFQPDLTSDLRSGLQTKSDVTPLRWRCCRHCACALPTSGVDQRKASPVRIFSIVLRPMRLLH